MLGGTRPPVMLAAVTLLLAGAPLALATGPTTMDPSHDATETDTLTWEEAPASPAGAKGWDIAASERAVVANTVNSGTFVSGDDGHTWEPVDALIDEGEIVFDPSDPDRAYFGGFGGVARTTDAGQTWELVLDADRTQSLAVSPTGTVVASDRDDDFNVDIVASHDGGETWAPLDWPEYTSRIQGLAFGASDEEVIVSTADNTSVTRDGGETWTFQATDGGQLMREGDGTLWRATIGDLYRSTDRGETWQEVSIPGSISTLAPRPGGGAYVATQEGLHVTTDGGQTWTDMGGERLTWAATGLVADPSDRDAVLMSDESIGVTWVGPDGEGGYTLEGRTTGFPEVELSAVAAGPDAAAHIAGGPLGLYASWDDGQTWTHTGGGIGVPTMGTVAAGPGGQAFYAGGQNHIFQAYIGASLDGGDTWHVAGPEANDSITVDLAVNPDDPAEAWAAVWTQLARDKVFETTDGGQTWEPILTLVEQEELRAVAYDASSGQLYAGTSLGVQALDPLTGLWTRASAAAPPGATDIEAANGHVYAPGSVTSLWHGTSQAPLLTPWADTGSDLERIAVDPASGTDVLALDTSQAMHRCQPQDDAPSGACSQATSPDATVRDIVIDTDGTAWAATVDDGLQIAQLG